MAEKIMQGRLALITGSTAGIGRAAAFALADMGASLVLVARNAAKAQQVATEIQAASPGASVEVLIGDLSVQAQVRKVAADFKAKHNRLDVLINNAGGVFSPRQVTADGLEMTFALNHLAYFLLTNLLLDTLIAGGPARVVSVSSGAHMAGHIDFDNLQGEKRYTSFGAYGRSKLANILFTTELARRLAGTGVTANAIHPGAVRSDFGMNTVSGPFRFVFGLARPFMLTPEQGADTLVYMASSPDVEGKTGGYYAKRKLAATSAEAKDAALAARLWTVSEQLTGLTGTLQPAAGKSRIA